MLRPHTGPVPHTSAGDGTQHLGKQASSWEQVGMEPCGRDERTTGNGNLDTSSDTGIYSNESFAL